MQETVINKNDEETLMSNTVTTEVDVHPTPNPNALKFILNTPVKNNGTSSYKTPIEAQHNNLAISIFTIRGIDQVHMFENVVTVTKFSYEDWETVEPQIIDVLKSEMPKHDANYVDPNPEEERRKALSPELLKIEEILDRTVRPGLQGDGGDLQTVSYSKEDHILLIKYQGACGTCPSSATGTLDAIKAILRDEFDPEIDVYIAPEY